MAPLAPTTWTVGLAPEPLIAEEGTTTTFSRLAVITLAWPVIPVLAPLGSLFTVTVTAYGTAVLVPAELPDDSEVVAMSLTLPVAVALESPSKVSATFWPT